LPYLPSSVFGHHLLYFITVRGFVLAIQHGFIAVLVFCGVTILATFFLKDLPMTQQSSEVSDEDEAVAGSVEDLSITP
jgi:hypothetical protein